eukprot:GHUV01025531.1.p1 GENE.GHUV01025531.1~~GHUV01025531.1.p1  ORF type:complete len:111 (-),score=7.89 GHUV01025531.1:786-1118(-)
MQSHRYHSCVVATLSGGLGTVISVLGEVSPCPTMWHQLHPCAASDIHLLYIFCHCCSLWQHCYCEADIHCPVGFKCVPANAFPEYKVCKAPMKDEPNTLLPKIFATMAGN